MICGMAGIIKPWNAATSTSATFRGKLIPQANGPYLALRVLTMHLHMPYEY